MTVVRFAFRPFAAGRRAEIDVHFRVDGAAPHGLDTQSWGLVISSMDPGKIADPRGAAAALWGRHLDHMALAASKRVLAPVGPVLAAMVEGPVLTSDEAAALSRGDGSAVLFVLVTFRWSDSHGQWNHDICFFTFGRADRIVLCDQHNGLRRPGTVTPPTRR
jgi:hypothetical protein